MRGPLSVYYGPEDFRGRIGGVKGRSGGSKSRGEGVN